MKRSVGLLVVVPTALDGLHVCGHHLVHQGREERDGLPGRVADQDVHLRGPEVLLHSHQHPGRVRGVYPDLLIISYSER